ncbi:hypothetical protein PG997_008263 [Apiospora hydei]|uniref:Uncharacterized protein n=1 Tax=Apiospora hydei TaxID=1337664 RepID=A0ABR1WA99_9PEZI
MTLPRVIKPLETKQDRVAKLASHLAQTERLRHIWLADAPPHYPSIYTASRVEKLLKEQIIKSREKRREARVSANPIADGRVPKTIQKLLDRWPLPLAVIAFTPRPTYFLPRNSPLRGAVAKGGVLSRLRLLFPRLPQGLGSAAQSRWDVFANSKSETATTAATTSPEEDAYDHVYETEARAPVDGRMPPFSGPGRLMLWTVADLHQPPSQEYRDGQRDNDMFSWAEALAQTTIRLLEQEFGIKARSDPSYSGLWVRRGRGDDAPERQIASIWPHVDEETNIVTAGITLNVGLPREVQILTEKEEMKESATASWSGAQPFDPDDGTTSIAAELAAKPASFNPKDRLKSDIIRLGKTLPVRQLGAPPRPRPPPAAPSGTRAPSRIAPPPRRAPRSAWTTTASRSRGRTSWRGCWGSATRASTTTATPAGPRARWHRHTSRPSRRPPRRRATSFFVLSINKREETCASADAHTAARLQDASTRQGPRQAAAWGGGGGKTSRGCCSDAGTHRKFRANDD